MPVLVVVCSRYVYGPREMVAATHLLAVKGEMIYSVVLVVTYCLHVVYSGPSLASQTLSVPQHRLLSVSAIWDRKGLVCETTLDSRPFQLGKGPWVQTTQWRMKSDSKEGWIMD